MLHTTVKKKDFQNLKSENKNKTILKLLIYMLFYNNLQPKGFCMLIYTSKSTNLIIFSSIIFKKKLTKQHNQYLTKSKFSYPCFISVLFLASSLENPSFSDSQHSSTLIHSRGSEK